MTDKANLKRIQADLQEAQAEIETAKAQAVFDATSEVMERISIH